MHLYIVDGHNLILTSRSLTEKLAYDGKRASREAAEDLLLRWAARASDVKVWLFYDGQDFPDGHPGNRDEGALRVRFTDPPAEADDRIVYEATGAAAGGTPVTVVTSDGGIADRLKETTVRFMQPAEFLGRFIQKPKGTKKEEHFTEEEQQSLAAEILSRTAELEEEGSIHQAQPSPAPATSQQMPLPKREPPRPKGPAVLQRPGKDKRRRAFTERQKRRSMRKQEPGKRKRKRRGF